MTDKSDILAKIAKEHGVSAKGFGDGNEINVYHFEQTLAFCSTIGKINRINKSISSYGLKHVCERLDKNYISNGSLIAAAIALGFQYSREGPNAYFNMSTRSLRAKFDEMKRL